MNQFHGKVERESPSSREQNVPADSSASRDGAVITPNQDRGGPQYRILVVDDDRHIRRFCADALIGSGYVVDTAIDGVTAWNALLQINYDLLLTDNKMPRVSGIELVKKVRSASINLPVVLMRTGSQSVQNQRKTQP